MSHPTARYPCDGDVYPHMAMALTIRLRPTTFSVALTKVLAFAPSTFGSTILNVWNRPSTFGSAILKLQNTPSTFGSTTQKVRSGPSTLGSAIPKTLRYPFHFWKCNPERPE